MAIRTVAHAFFYSRRGIGSRPFLLQFTNLYPSNISVDKKNWNFTVMIGLEWVCALPMEMLHALPLSLAPPDPSFSEDFPCPLKYDQVNNNRNIKPQCR